MIIFVTVNGRKNGRLIQETYASKVYSGLIAGEMHSAIQITTAGSICAVLDMLANGSLRAKGFVRQEEIALTHSSPTASVATTRTIATGRPPLPDPSGPVHPSSREMR